MITVLYCLCVDCSLPPGRIRPERQSQDSVFGCYAMQGKACSWTCHLWMWPLFSPTGPTKLSWNFIFAQIVSCIPLNMLLKIAWKIIFLLAGWVFKHPVLVEACMVTLSAVNLSSIPREVG